MASRTILGRCRFPRGSGGGRRRIWRGLFAALMVACMAVGASDSASALHPFRHRGFGWGGFGACGVGPFVGGGWCGPRFGFGCGPAWGWGGPGFGWGGCWPAFGSVSFGTGFGFGGTRFWSGSTILGVPFWGGCAPVWGGPCFAGPVFPGPFWGGPFYAGPCYPGPFFAGPFGRSPVSAWYGGWMAGPAAGWNVGPARGWNIPFAALPPAGMVPGVARVPGPAGWPAAPRMLASRPNPRRAAAAPGRPGPDAVAGVWGGGRGALGAPAIDTAVEASIRTSNAPARARAARIVKAGDRHLRGSLDDPRLLAKAVDAYRRAATIAGDQPDIFLRQAIALTASGKRDAAASALARAVAIDARLADAAAGGGAMPPGAGAGATALDLRGAKLMERIFAAEGAATDTNWIARSWADRGPVRVMVAAHR